jgi:hypothetical protein
LLSFRPLRPNAVASAGVGTRHVAHLEANWAANDLALDAETVAELERAFPRGSTVGARYPAEAMRQIPPEPAAA